MQYETVSLEEFGKRAKLAGVTLTPRVINKNIKGVEITDALGKSVLIEMRGYSDLEVMVPTKPKLKAWKVKATLPVIGPFERVYFDQDQAREAKLALADWSEDADYEGCEVEQEEGANVQTS